MRFRLGTTGAGNPLFDGVSRGFQSMSMAPLFAAQAAEEGQRVQAEMGLRAAQQRQADAHAALFQQQAEDARTQAQRGGVGELLRTAALARGVPLHQLDEATNYFQSGQLEPRYEMPANIAGPTMPKPGYADPGLGSQIMQTLGLSRQALTLGDKSVDNVAQATGRYQQQDAVRQVQADPSRAGVVGQSFAAASGKPLVDNIGDTGETFNLFTGGGGVASPGLRAIYGNVQGANILRDKAAAASSYASAGASRALEDQRRHELEQGRRTGDLQVVTGQDGAITVVNKRDLTAQQVLDAQGRPVIKGTSGGGGKPLTEGQAKANLFGGRMLESAKVLSELEDKGVLRPGGIKSFAEGVAGGVPIIGGSLREGAHAATNWTQSPQQQQVDQARRDFINAVMRRESGAVISPEEFANADKQYFPQMGDSPQVREQKRRNRMIATTLMLQEVPEAQRYRLGAAGAPPPPAGPVAPEGSWGGPATPAGRNVRVDF